MGLGALRVIPVENPMFEALTQVRKELDNTVPLILKAIQKEKGYDAAWARIDTEDIKVETQVEGDGACAVRLKWELGAQANAIAQVFRKQVLPSYYLVEKSEGFVKNNAKKLQWKYDAEDSKQFTNLVNLVAGKQLSFKQSITIKNPLFWVPDRRIIVGIPFILEDEWFTVTVKCQLKIRVDVYDGELAAPALKWEDIIRRVGGP